jgi:hypothetical protein
MLTTNPDQKPVIKFESGGNSTIDLEAIIEQIWTELGGRASRSDKFPPDTKMLEL